MTCAYILDEEKGLLYLLRADNEDSDQTAQADLGSS